MKLLEDYINNPTDPDINNNLGDHYYAIGQLASATTHYLKAADNYKHLDLIANMLFKTAMCFKNAGGRFETVTALLKRSIALCPYQKEAYIELAGYYEGAKLWHDCYMISCIAEVGTYDYRATFFRGVSAWWIGNTEEAREVMYWLWTNIHKMQPEYQKLVLLNVQNIGFPQIYTQYKQGMFPALKRRFPGAENIEKNYAQCYQDLYALFANKGKTDGYYLELGCADPIKNNNTYLLETLGWKGISIDIDYSSIQKFRKERRNIAIHANGLELDYSKLLEESKAPKVIDYLQIDCDPPHISLEILKKMPFNEYRFNCITFEHDFYADPSIREQSRDWLRKHNYELVASDIAFMEGKSFEDWWIHTSVAIPHAARDVTKSIKTAREYMFDTEALKNSS